jgi:hypothetical protein
MNHEKAISKHVQAMERRLEALEKQYPPLTTIEARIAALEETASAPSLRGCKLWASCTALLQRTAALEKIANSDDLATSFVKDAWRKDINERIAKIELPMTKESDASIKDHNENMCERFNDIEEKVDKLMEIKNEKEE